MKNFPLPLLFVMSLIVTAAAETDGAKLTDQELADKLATKVPTLPPGIKTRSAVPSDARTRLGVISPDAYEKTRSAIDLARTRAVRLNPGTANAPTTTANPVPPATKEMALECPVSMASGVAFRLQFKFNQATFVDPEGAGQELNKIAKALKTFVDPSASTPVSGIREQFLIEGHTCDIGEDRPNQILSEKRAMAVRQQLLTRGLPAEMLLILGQGKSHPDVANTSELNRAQNRRVAVFRVGEKVAAK